jgi:hypothetical protein
MQQFMHNAMIAMVVPQTRHNKGCYMPPTTLCV